MSALRLKDDIYWIGVKNPELRVFDIIMETKKGTTYNAYLIDDEKVAIIDSVKNGYSDEFMCNIEDIIGHRNVDYIVVQHTELDHSGSLKDLLEKYPDATIVGSNAAINYCKNILNREFKSIAAKQDLNLGKYTLKFINAPNLHWPDSIFTYLESEKILFTCDFFGSHYSPINSIRDDINEEYYIEMKYYFDCIMGPFKRFVNMALGKIENLECDIVAPSHGPIHTSDGIDHCKNLYKEWAKEIIPEKNNISIFYISAYGNTEYMAKFFGDKLRDNGFKVEVHDITEIGVTNAVALIEKCCGFLIGSPTINQDAVEPSWHLLSYVNPIINRCKKVAAFGSYGWSGEGVPMLTERLKSLKLDVMEGFNWKFVPSENEIKEAEEFINKYMEMFK